MVLVLAVPLLVMIAVVVVAGLAVVAVAVHLTGVVALVTHPDQNVRFVVSLGIVPRLAGTGTMKMMPLNSALRL